MQEVMGLPTLLRSIASRLEGDIDGLNKELLRVTADKIDRLEQVARLAVVLIQNVPVKSSGSLVSKVPRDVVSDLVVALNIAGRYGPNGEFVKQRR